MKDRTLDYLDKLRPYITNERGQSPQIYKNYRNEGVANYPHIQSYQKTLAQQAEAHANEKSIMGQYETNKNQLNQGYEAQINEYKAKQAQQLEYLRGEEKKQAEENIRRHNEEMAVYFKNLQKKPVPKPTIAPALKPRTLFTIAPDTPVEFHNTQTANGVLSRFVLPFSTYGANHPYMKLTGDNLNHGKWYDPNNSKYYDTQF